MKREENKNEVVENIKINPPKKLGFFKRIQVSIFKVENYGEFVLEKTKVAIQYFFKLILLVAIVTAIISTYQVHTMVTKGINYLKNEMPDFNLSDGKITFVEDTEAYDKDLDFYVRYSTSSELSDSVIKDIEKQVQNYSTAIIYLQDRIVYYNGVNYSYFKYSDLMSEYHIDITNKQNLINLIDRIGIYGIDTTCFIASFIASYLVNIINVAFDVILVFLFGMIAARFCGVNMPSTKILSLSIYSLTLSILLNMIYMIAYNLTNFYIQYFELMYILIAYIYLVAAILIIKSDVIKQKLELQKIIEVQKQVKKEIEEQKEEENKEDNKKDDTESDKKEKDKKQEEEDPILNREPDGSEI